MRPQRQKTKFGELLDEYLKRRGYSKAELERLLYANGYQIGNGLVGKYEYGTRRPPAEFFVRVALVLQLDQDEAMALVELYLAQLSMEFMNNYWAAWKKWLEGDET
jgi:transcriptional regulator with XRE-family HTH domain